MRDPYEIFKNKLFFEEAFTGWGFRHVTKEILRILKDNNSKTVLEVCCGTGKLSEKITGNGMEVTGIDMSRTMLDRAIKKKRAKRLIFQDATRKSFEDEFDAAIVQIALHEMTPSIRGEVFENMKKAVKKDGIIIVSDISHSSESTINARINGYFVRKGEEQFLDTYPEHYHNYIKFMEIGGVRGFLEGEKIISDNYFMGGHIGVIAIAN